MHSHWQVLGNKAIESAETLHSSHMTGEFAKVSAHAWSRSLLRAREVWMGTNTTTFQLLASLRLIVQRSDDNSVAELRTTFNIHCDDYTAHPDVKAAVVDALAEGVLESMLMLPVRRFVQLFICLQSAKQLAESGVLLPVLLMDGTFSHHDLSILNGVVLLCIGKDGAYNSVALAYAVVRSEHR